MQRHCLEMLTNSGLMYGDGYNSRGSLALVDWLGHCARCGAASYRYHRWLLRKGGWASLQRSLSAPRSVSPHR